MIDLHTHSTVSDGSETPERVIELAAEAGLSAVALTDHDRLDGIPAALGAASAAGIDLVPGCELSCEHRGTMHILVYFLVPGFGPLGAGSSSLGAGPLQDELIRLQAARDARNRSLADRLGTLGLPVTLEEMEAEAGGSGVGRPHVAAVLVRKGVVATVQEAFDKWLGKGQPGYIEKDRLSPADALRLARASGGVPVLAHPLSLGLDPVALATAIRELASLGLVGVEAIYGRYDPSERAGIAALAAEAGLAVTGGSDFHGRYKPDLAVGTGRGDLAVPDALLDRLRETVV